MKNETVDMCVCVGENVPPTYLPLFFYFIYIYINQSHQSHIHHHIGWILFCAKYIYELYCSLSGVKFMCEIWVENV